MNREEWLTKMAELVAPWFEEQGYPLPERYKMTCGWTSKGTRGNRIGECWASTVSEGGFFEIFISPRLNNSYEVAGTAIHELVHAAVGLECGHKGPFKTLARALGLEGKLTATYAGEALIERLTPVLEQLGPYPHARLNPGTGKSSGPKKQSTRLIKCQCEECGFTLRTTRSWLETIETAMRCPNPACEGKMEFELPGE